MRLHALLHVSLVLGFYHILTRLYNKMVEKYHKMAELVRYVPYQWGAYGSGH